MTLQPGLQTIAIHIFTNISRDKGNQEMEFSQLIEYDMRKNFLQKLYIKYGRESIRRHFLKKQH